MSRQPRIAPGGWVYHVVNRSVGRIKLFRTDEDFQAFDRLLLQTHERFPLRILSYCVMSNHWHFVVWPKKDGELTAFFRWLAHTHAMRWRVSHRNVGYGHLYQGRFKSFVIKQDQSLLQVCRYVERNPLTADAVRRAERWHWGSLWVRQQGTEEQKAILSDWPISRPGDWVEHVNEPITGKEREQWQTSLERSRPFGDDKWVIKTVAKLGLEHTIRREGRPAKVKKDDEAADGGRKK